MRQRELELALKKQQLLMRSAEQRQRMAVYAEGLQPVFSTADKAIAGALWLRQHPAVIAVSSAALFIFRPRFLVRLAVRGYSTWRLVQAFRSRNRY